MKTHRYASHNTLFDRFAGVYHAFERLRYSVVESIERGEPRAAESKLFGAKHDSLPELLQKTLDQNEDPVMRYIVFLCGRQLYQRVRAQQTDFCSERVGIAKRLEGLLQCVPQLAAELPIDETQREQFLAWYEEMFDRVAQTPEDSA